MSRVKASLDHKRIRRLIWLVLTVFVLLGYSLQSVAGSVGYSMLMQVYGTVSSPPVVLEEGNVSGVSTIYTNKTSAKVSVEAPLFDYVDSNDPDVDSSADKGMHSNFSAQQAGPDSMYDTLTEENTEGIEDYVDSISDVDNSADVGNHSNFENEKLKDGTYDTLIESAGEIIRDGVTQGQSTSATVTFSHILGYSSGNNRLVVVAAGFEHSSGDVNIASATYNGQSMTKIVQATVGGTGYSTSTAIFYILDSNLPVNSGSYSVVVTCASDPFADLWACAVSYIGVKQEAPDDYDSDYASTSTTMTSQLNCDEDGSMLVQACVVGDTGSFSPSPGTTEVIEDSDINSASAVFNEKLGQDSGARDLGCTHSSMNRGSWVGACWAPASEDYDLDIEVQFTSVIDFLPTEKLCIYTGTLGDEDLKVDYWNGTGWENLATDLNAYSCNYYTVSLTSTNFTIRFKDGTTTGDTTQDQWQIDASLLRVEGAGSKEDMVDQQSNVDGSADVGTHDVFADLQASDNSYDNMTEAVGAGDYDSTVLGLGPDFRWELDGDETDSVDNGDSDGGNDPSWVSNIIPNGATQCGDYDGTADVTLIPNNDTINGATTYQKSISVWVEIDTIDTTGNGRIIWGEGGPSNGLAIYAYNGYLYFLVYESSNRDYVSYAVSTSTLYHIGATMDAPAGEIHLYVNGEEVANKTGGLNIGTSLNAHQAGCGFGGPDYDLLNHDGSTMSGYFEGRIADVAYYAEQTVLTESNFNDIYTAGTSASDYQLELEVQFTGIPDEADSMPVQRLCVEAGTLGSENILVQWWNGSGWETLWSDLTASSWNNASIAGNLTGSTFTIRFRDGTQSGDTTTADSWFIDSVLIYLENTAGGVNYEIDLEVQWTNAVYTRTNEELCIKTGTFSDSENIQVKVWNNTGNSWHWVMNLTASQWNNVSITSYLISSTFTVQFLGGTETGDTNEDSWNIDATVLHVWTSEGTYDYVLKVVNQETNNWTVNLQIYDSSNIGRLSSLNISLHDGTSSNQIAVSGGSMVKSEGEPYDLPGGVNSTIYISVSNLQATTTGTSYLYVHLKVRVPNSSTYILYVITFEVT